LLSSHTTLSVTDDKIAKLRNEEANIWIVALQSEAGEELMQTALALQDSGINHTELFDAAKTVVLDELVKLNSSAPPKESKYIISSLSRFLAGSSNFEHLEVLDTLVAQSSSKRVANLANTLKTRLAWYQSRDRIMNDFSAHNPQESLHIKRFKNLIRSDNFEFGRYAAESLTRLNDYDKAFTEIMAEKVKMHYKSPGTGTQLDAIAWYLRFLGREGSYSALIREVAEFDKLDKKLKKHVRLALQGK